MIIYIAQIKRNHTKKYITYTRLGIMKPPRLSRDKFEVWWRLPPPQSSIWCPGIPFHLQHHHFPSLTGWSPGPSALLCCRLKKWSFFFKKLQIHYFKEFNQYNSAPLQSREAHIFLQLRLVWTCISMAKILAYTVYRMVGIRSCVCRPKMAVFYHQSKRNLNSYVRLKTWETFL